LASLYLTTGRPDQAKKIYTGVLAATPANIGALLGLADIAIPEMKWQEANDYIARARAAAPNDPAPGLKLVKLYAAQRDWRNAVASATEIAKNSRGISMCLI
jgi:predicted Zn-dependent protease